MVSSDKILNVEILKGRFRGYFLFVNKLFVFLKKSVFILNKRRIIYAIISHIFPKSYNRKHLQKQPSRGVLRKRCSKNMPQIYRRTPMPKCDFNKAAE